MFLKIIMVALMSIAATTYAEQFSGCEKLFDSDGMATQGLSELLTITKTQIPATRNIYQVCAALEKWRNFGPNRWEFKLPAELKNTKDKVINICEHKLDMQETILPKNFKYSGVLFLGATLSRVIDRLSFYKKLVNSGRVDKTLKMWVLSGDRKIAPEVGETPENFSKIVISTKPPIPIPTDKSDELEMIKFIFYYQKPEEINTEYVYSEKESNYHRATTASTIEAWLKKIPTSPQKTYYLAISNQPFVNYQNSVISYILSKTGRAKDIEIHTIGGETNYQDKENQAAILLNTVAKTIYNCKNEMQLMCDNYRY